MNRYKQREQALQLVFESMFADNAAKGNTEELCSFFEECMGELGDYAKALFEGVMQHAEELDAYIVKYANGWRITRIPKINVALLRIAMYEIAYVDETPTSVAVNEAVELAKKYSGADDPAFINGILGTYVKNLPCS